MSELFHTSQAIAGRIPPHSIEAEEYLLACCLIDGNETVARCAEAKLPLEAFYSPANRLIFEIILEMNSRGVPVEYATLREELATSKQLDEVGGDAFLVQVSSRVPTTAQANHFIEKIRELFLLRRLIQEAVGTVETCYDYRGGLDELLAGIRGKVEAIADQATLASGDTSIVRFSIDDLLSFKGEADVNTLLGRRYLCRTQTLLLVSQSGIGKSVAATQAGCSWALGRDFFGIRPARALRILYVQAENDLGDAAEAFQGIANYLGITKDPAAIALLRQNFRVCRFGSETGASFIARLKKENRDFNADVVIADPLLSFLGADASDQRAVSEFLRGQVNDFLFKSGAAMIFVHHTGKPPAQPQRGKTDVDKSYAGIGTSELTNWARAVIVLERELPDRPVYRMTLTKRGTRAGIVDEAGHTVTRVYIEHSPKGICWVPSDFTPTEKGKRTQFTERFPVEEMRRHYEPNFDWSDNRDRISKALGCDAKTVDRKRHLLTSS